LLSTEKKFLGKYFDHPDFGKKQQINAFGTMEMPSESTQTTYRIGLQVSYR
jgi:hypothetical protein